MSVRVFVPPADPGQVVIRVRPGAPEAPDRACEARWAALVRENPRLFDGPILAVEAVDLASGIVRCRRERFRRLAVQPQVPTGVELLSVTGVLTARDAQDADHVLVGRRAPQTRIYGGLWELAPSGGIDAPGDGVARMPWPSVVAALERELGPETGLPGPLDSPRLLGAVRDHDAFSLDLAVRGCLARPVERLPLRGNWEYTEARWLRVDRVPEFCAAEPVVGATLALFSLLGWR